ncbi:MAG: response regulator [Acidobacteriia bacterium]|nr:response regulator [Terriglobia bacterium]MBV9745450.1 response regulator [Terriglobia bacterium]
MQPSKPRVLFVDDDPDLLAGIARTLRSERFEIQTMTSARSALERLERHEPFAAIVSDLKMPEMDGITVLQKAWDCAPDCVRVLFTGEPDLDHAIAAVNKGAIFRFMVKPCSRVVMAMTLNAAVEQHLLMTAEKVLLEQTLNGSIQALMEVLSLTAPMAFGRASRLRQTVERLAAACAIPNAWHVRVAAVLSQIGYVTLPPATLEKVYQALPISEPEQTMLDRMPAVVEQILGNIPRLEPVREILKFQEKHFDGGGLPVGPISGEAIPWGSRALKIAVDLDALESEGLPVSVALGTLRGRSGRYDRVLLGKLEEIRNNPHQAQVRELPLHMLEPGMILAQDVRTDRGVLFVARGQDVTPSLIEKLRNFTPGIFQEGAIRVILPGIN